METRRSTGSLSSLTGSGTLTPPMSPRVESPRAAAAVGEKRQGSGKGIYMQIEQLANEQERIQKKTFTNWMNTYLKQKNMKVENLFEDIKDGVYLLSLLEALSGEKLQMERGKLKRVHHVSNISTALKFLEMKKIKLVNINVSDIADGKPSIVLGLTWTIILSFQIVDTFAQQEHDPDKPLSALEKFRMNAKKALLAWTGNAITKKYGIKISDFGKSWRDGLAFNAIVHTIRPDLIDFENVRNQSARANLEQAFSTAEDHLGIARLLDPEDVDVEKPDEKSIMTYVAQFLKAYPEAGEDPALGRRSKDPAFQEMNEYTDLMTWLSAEAEEVLQIVDQPVTDRQQEYMDYLAFKAELDRREAVYKKLEEKCLAKKALKITEPMWTELNTKWRSAARRTRMWLWKLDASLPGKLGKFGDWLNQGEEVLEQQPEDVQDRYDLAQKLAKLLQESAEYFKDAESWKTFFYEVKRAGKYEGEFLIQPQIDSLANRLTALLKEYPRREKRLAFEEYQQKVQALRESAEAKLQVWTEKLGQQEDVELMLEDYNDFVNTKQLFHTYNSLSTNLSKKADVWKKSAGKEREQEVKKFIEEENTQWKKVSEDIKTVLPNLEKGLENWKLYNNGIETLTSFINEGESVMSRSAEEKQQHFSETPENEEKLRQVNDSGNFLMEVCSESIADEIRQTLASLNTEFKTVTESFEEFKRVEIIGKGKQEYAEGVNRISEWLKNAEELMLQPVPCIHANLKDHLQDLTMCSSQIPEMENDFKSTTKTAQSLVKDSSPDVVSEMLQTLNVQKEVIVRLRKEIPERIKYLKAMLPNVESLETGISDLGIWLDKGDTVLSANKTYCKCMPVHFSKENRHDHACTSRSDCACGVQMMESRNEAQDFVGCDLCQQPVSFFCRRCGVNLCDPCVPIHLRVKSKNGHDIVDYTSKDDDDTCHCDSHPQNDSSAYCKTCDAPICILCVSNKHKSHEMSELSDKIEELLKVIAKENDRLQSSKHELEKILEHTTKLLSSISSIYKQRKDEVTARGEEWHKQIEETVKILHRELDDMQKEHEAVLQKQKKEFEEMIGKVDEMNGKTVKLKKSKNVNDMQTFLPVIQNRKNLNEFPQYSFPTFYECKIDTTYLQTYFGYVEKMQVKNTSLLENEFKERELSGKTILEVPTVTSVIETGFPADEKNKNRLYDMAVTDDNKVWMGGYSKDLKLFDLQGHLHHTVRITAKGGCLCLYNKQVVYTANKGVNMISDTNTIVTMFTTGDWEPSGVTSAACGDLLVCLLKDDQSKVVRYSSTGNVLQEIQYDSQCQPLYKEATYITENVNGDIIVTDWKKNAVIAVDRLGIFRYSYSGKDSDFNVSSVATDSVGHVIVTDFRGHKIHMLDRDGRFLRYIIPDGGINRPRAVCILGHGEMMVGECLKGIAKRIKYLEE